MTSARAKNHENPIVIKKYANRRLYNTETSTYVTLDDLCEMVKRDEDFVVYDAKNGDDITRSVLTQIIFEQESKGTHLLPVNFLRQVIGFYDNSMRDFLPQYLEASMDAFITNQEKMRSVFGGAVGNLFPFAQFEEMGKQNMAMMQKAFSMFSPFANMAGKHDDGEAKAPEEQKKAKG